jgi:hypothetical protein
MTVLRGGGEIRALGYQLRPPPSLEGAVDAGSSSDLDDFSGNERGDGHGPCCGDIVMGVVSEPACAEEEDWQGSSGGGDEGAPESCSDVLHASHDKAGSNCCDRVGEEIAAVGAQQMCDAAGSVWGEDGKAGSAFDEVEDHRGEARDGAEKHADEEDGEVLECERDRREGKRERDVSAGRDERGRTNDEEGLAGEGVLKRSGAMADAELRGDSGLHRAGPFVLEELG